MNQSYPVPPQELVGQWLCSEDYPWGPLEQTSITITTNRLQNVATQAARWGADMELEACLDWLDDTDCEDPQEVAQHLRAHRRPKPPSLKEQVLEQCNDYIDPDGIIRRALEQLPDAM